MPDAGDAVPKLLHIVAVEVLPDDPLVRRQQRAEVRERCRLLVMKLPRKTLKREARYHWIT